MPIYLLRCKDPKEAYTLKMSKLFGLQTAKLNNEKNKIPKKNKIEALRLKFIFFL